MRPLESKTQLRNVETKENEENQKKGKEPPLPEKEKKSEGFPGTETRANTSEPPHPKLNVPSERHNVNPVSAPTFVEADRDAFLVRQPVCTPNRYR